MSGSGSERRRGALDGVRIVECAQDIAAPYAAMLLAEQGADVIKVEPPAGDRARRLPGFAVWNRSKRGIVADRATAAGRASLRNACATADVFISDWSADHDDLRYAALAADNPRLIHCWMPAFGGRGDAAQTFADDDLVAARSGLLASQWAHREGPAFLTLPVSSYGAALLAAGAVCAALLARERTGRGQHLDVSWLAGALAMQTGSIVYHPALERVMQLVRDPLGPIPVYRLFKASDAWLFIACGNTTFWNKLCLVLERPEMVSDPRFEGAPWGVSPAYWADLKQLVQSIIATRSRDEWLRLLNAVDIPCAPVMTRFDFLDDPQVEHLGLRQIVDDPVLGRTIQMGLPVHLRDTPGAIRGPSPHLENVPFHSAQHMLREPQHERFQSPSGFQNQNDPSAHPEALEGCAPPSSVQPPSISGPLAGTLVLDFTNYIAGPMAGLALALAGADVIKIETPQGDPFRVFGFGFHGWNQGKRALALDFSKPEARDVVYDLVRKADVLIENLRPGATRRLGIDYATVAQLNPRLVYGSLTAFGSSGPRGHEAGFDPLLQARSGIMAAQGGHGQDPVFLACAVCDYGAGLLCAFGVMAALIARRRTGRGQLVETSLAQAALAVQAGEFIFYDGRPDMENGGADLIGRHALRRAYQCADGWIFVSAAADAAREIVNRVQLALSLSKGESCSAPPPPALDEYTNQPADGPTAAWLSAICAARPRSEMLATLNAAGAPAAPVLSVAELFDDPHIAANELFATCGDIRQTGALVKYADTPAAIQRGAPTLGEHNEEILRDMLGYPADRIATLRAAGVILG